MEAPPLPEPAGRFQRAETAAQWYGLQPAPYLDAFTARQLMDRDAYWLAKVEEAVKAERERCARIADGYANEEWYGAEGARRVATSIREGG